MKPSSTSLFKTIKGFMQMTHIMRMIRVNKTRRSTHISRFLRVLMKECILDIKLTNFPFFKRSNSEYDSDGGGFNNRAKRISIVNTK